MKFSVKSHTLFGIALHPRSSLMTAHIKAAPWYLKRR
jgi:hypothetical protein